MGNKIARRRGLGGSSAAGGKKRSLGPTAALSVSGASVSGLSSPSSDISSIASGSASSSVSEVRVKGYIVEDFLGEGGFSKVYRGRDAETGRPVALKMLKLKRKGAKKDISVAIAEVRKEVEAMLKATHVNVLKLIEVDWECEMPTEDLRSTQIAPLIVLELAEGGDFFEFLMVTGGFDEIIARSYFRQLIAGIKACHTRGVVHRDLKPENLLLDKDFILKIADFGLASVKTKAGDDTMKTVVGSRAYMAPEVIEGVAYNASVDIFAAGILVFLMIAGFPPFVFASESDWWYNLIVSEDYENFWKHHCARKVFSDDAKDLIQRMIVYDPASRITIAEIEEHPWFKGEVFAPEELKSEMLERKSKILKKKKRDAKSQALSSSGTRKSRGEEEVHRGIESLFGPDAPKDPPGLLPAFKGDRTVVDDDSTIGSSLAFADFDAPTFDEKDAGVCYNRLDCKCTPAEIVKPITNALTDMQVKSNFNASGWIFDAKYFDKDNGLSVEFDVLIYKNGSGSLVELYRRTGNTVLLGSIFNDLIGDLGEHLVDEE